MQMFGISHVENYRYFLLQLRNSFSTYVWEYYFILILGIPGALTCVGEIQLSQMSLLFLGHYSSNPKNILSGLYFAHLIFGLTAFLITESLGITLQMFCSNSNGAKSYKQCGIYFQRGLLLSSLTWIPVIILWKRSQALLDLFIDNNELTSTTGIYLSILCYAYPFYCFNKLSLRFINSQYVIMETIFCIIIPIAANIVLQYFLVDQWGVHGSGIATVVAQIIQCSCLIVYIKLSGIANKIKFSFSSIEPFLQWYHFLKQSISIMFIKLCDLAPDRVSALIIYVIFKDSIQLSILGILCLVWWSIASCNMGVGSAVAIHIANLLGENNFKQAKKATIIAIVGSFPFLLICPVLFFTIPKQIALIFTYDLNLVRQLTYSFRLLSLFTIADVTYILRGIAYGCGLSTFTSLVQVLSIIFVSLPCCILLTFVCSNQKAAWGLVGNSFGLAISVIPIIARLCLSNWKSFAQNAIKNANNIEIRSLGKNHDIISQFEQTYRCTFGKYLSLLIYVILILTEASIFAILTIFHYL